MPKATAKVKPGHVTAEKCELCGKLDLDVELSDDEMEKKRQALFKVLDAADAEIEAGIYDDSPTEEFFDRVYARAGLSRYRK